MNRKNNALVRSALGVYTCRQNHEHGPAKYTLIYNTDNVLAFGVSFKVGENGQELRTVTTWFSRDQFSDWLQKAPGGATLSLGECGARIRKSAPYTMTMKFAALTLSDGVTKVSPMLLISRDFLTGFIAMTYDIVPRDDEAAFLQLDACLEKILDAK